MDSIKNEKKKNQKLATRDQSISPVSRGWGRWGCSAWRREGSGWSHDCV